MDPSSRCCPIHSSPESQVYHQWWSHHSARRYRYYHNDREKILGVWNLQALNTFTSYQFEVVHLEKEATELKRKVEILPPKFNMIAKIKFHPNKGLGKHSQERKNPVKAIRVPSKAGLGSKPLIKYQLKKNKKMKVGLKTAQHFVLAS